MKIFYDWVYLCNQFSTWQLSIWFGAKMFNEKDVFEDVLYDIASEEDLATNYDLISDYIFLPEDKNIHNALAVSKSLISTYSLFSYNNLIGMFLLATDSLKGTALEKAVVYVCSHSENGALGVILNRTILNINLASFFKEWIKNITTVKMPNLNWGGMSGIESIFMLHSLDKTYSETIKYNGNIGITPSMQLLKDFIADNGPKDILFIMGYTNWTQNQLEKEISDGLWIPLPAQSDIIFSKKSNDMWGNIISQWHISQDSITKCKTKH